MSPLDFDRIIDGVRRTGQAIAGAVVDAASSAYLRDHPDSALTEFSFHGARFLFDATEGIDRTVLAIGFPSDPGRSREESYQRGFPIAESGGGRPLDRGHMLPYTAGGGYGPNLFAQDRALNRGWSNDGRAYRAMERRALSAPVGTLFAVSLVYVDQSAMPAFVQLAILGPDGCESRVFRNRFDKAEGTGWLSVELEGATDAQVGALGEETTAVLLEDDLRATLVALGDAGMPRDAGRQDLDLVAIVEGELVAFEVKTRYRSARAGRLTRQGNLTRPRLKRGSGGHRQASQEYVAERIGELIELDDGYQGIRVQIVVVDLMLMVVDLMLMVVDLMLMVAQFFDVTDDGAHLRPAATPLPCSDAVRVAMERIRTHRGHL